VGGELSIRMPSHQGLFCYAVLQGGCWLILEGGAGPVRLAAGDCVVLPSGRPFVIASHPDLPSVEAGTMFAERVNGGMASYNGGGDCLLYAGHFDFDSRESEMLLSVLPPLVRIREEDDRATLRWSLNRMMTELRDPRPGGDLIVEHLAHLVLVQALRLYLAEGDADRASWLSALADPKIGAVISAIHRVPARGWTVQAMASEAGMSRTAFALRFKETVGMSPMEYLTRWRMLLAAGTMRQPDKTVSSIAFAVGYISESAFSTAFKRVMGCSPRRYAVRA
jgi:AraC-like DNA-binding protein